MVDLITAMDGVVPPTRLDPVNFGPRGDIVMAKLPVFQGQLNTFATQMNALGVTVSSSTSLVITKAAEAAQDALDAADALADTQLSAAAALGSELNAAQSALQAANAATGLTATSTSAVAIGLGLKTFTVPAGKQFVPNISVQVVDQADAANKMSGVITSYIGTTLSVTVTSVEGDGTKSAWNISVAGSRGAQGPAGNLNGGNLAGGLNEAKAADVDSTVTPGSLDIWSGAGNYLVLTNSGAISGFSAAPQAGAKRMLLIGGAPTLVASANVIIKGAQSGSSMQLAAGDEVIVRAETTTKFRVTVVKGDGAAAIAKAGGYLCVRIFGSSGIFTARVTGWHRILIWGGGARGGMAANNAGPACATGASGPGFAIAYRYLIAGTSYVVTIGAALSSGATISGPAASNGQNGNPSSVSGSGIVTVTANGGNGGFAQINSTALLNGPVGGTAVGGDINIQGGAAGSAQATSNSAGCHAASGGATLGLQGTGFKSGNAVSRASGNYVASGGAAIGGASPDADSSGTAATAGAGAGGPAVGGTAGPNVEGQNGGPALTVAGNWMTALFNATGGGTAPSSAAQPPNGGSSGANGTASAGTFGSSGAYCTGSANPVAANAGTGASTGGVVGLSSASQGVAGSGGCVIEWMNG